MQSTQELDLLQQAADYVVVRKEVKVSGIFATIFGALALFAAVTPPADPLLLVVGGMLAAAGLWNLTNPHPRGIAFMGVCLIAVGLFNVASGFLEAAAGRHPFVGWQVLGVWQVIWGVQAFGRYRRFALAFQSEPGTAHREQAKQAIHDLQRAKPKKSPDVIEFVVKGLTPRAGRVRLAADHAFCLLGNGEDLFVCPRERFDIRATGHSRWGKTSQVVIEANGRTLQGAIEDKYLERFNGWKAGAAPALAAAA